VSSSSDGYVLSADKSLLDLDRIERWLAVESYWAAGRPRDVIERSIANSFVVGAYSRDGVQVGITRAVTDHATFAWICDVYVDSDHRGHGLGQRLVGSTMTALREDGIYRFLLATRDAHGVYAKVGFSSIKGAWRWMEIDGRETRAALSDEPPVGFVPFD
jgi:GNAT superfamily N-acetyltransferase